MDRIKFREKLSEMFDKYKYVLLVIALGLALMLWPSNESPAQAVQMPPQPVHQESVTEELTDILGQIRGVGRVRVMVTERTGAQTHYQTDESGSQDAAQITNDSRTVLISSGGEEAGLIKSVSAPVYLGAIVVCQGADDPAVCLAISQAVSAVTGITTDRISVLKMK